MGRDLRPGRSIVILGPDGAGKTLLADALTERLRTSRTVHRAHGNPRFLPRRTPLGTPVLEPHASRPYGRVTGFVKLLYLFVDVGVAWRFLIPRLLRQGSWIVVERGWWDVVIDPRRYRLRPGHLTARLGRLLPQADLTVVLGGRPDVLYRRKTELPIDEIARQIDVARTLLPPSPGVLHLDAAHPIAELVEAVMDRLDNQPARGRAAPMPWVDEWARLPRGRSQRTILIPRTPRRLATAGLRVYHPATRRGYVAWLVARRLAALGGARLLPRGAAPPELSLLNGVVPPNTTFAIASSRHPNRSTALCLGPDGELIAIAKLATDDAGRARLAREARMARELVQHLVAPLSSPAILAEGPGYLVFEPLVWKPRWASSELPDDVAAAMGSLYRAGGTADNERGVAHGDFAPWNMLRTSDGWAMIDWADAELDAPPFHDVFHYLVQSSVLLGTPHASDILAGLHGTGPVARPLRAYAESAGIPASRAKEFLAEYLETSSSRLQAGSDQARGLTVRRNLLEQLGRDAPGPQAAAAPVAVQRPDAKPRIRRAGWGIGDQALSSLTNFALAIALARQLSLPEFGAAGIAFAVYLIVLNASRALSTEPLTVRYSGVTEAAWRSGSATAVGSALAIGVLAGALSAIAGALLGGVTGVALVALGVSLPGLLVQDAWRYAFFAAGRARSAFLNDLAWAVLLVPAFIVAAELGGGGPAPYLLAWGLAATGAAVVGGLQGRLVPAATRFPQWLREQRDLAPRYFVEFVVLSGAAQLRLLLVGAIADLAVVGALRGGQVLLGALHPLTYGLQLTMVPDAVRAARHSTAPLRQLTVRLALALAAISFVFGVGLTLLPDDLGQALLGATWTEARPTLPGQTLVVAASGAALGALVGLRALAAASRSMRARIVASAFGLVGAIAGAATGDAAVCALLIGVGVAAGALVWWREYLVALRLVPTVAPHAQMPSRPEGA